MKERISLLLLSLLCLGMGLKAQEERLQRWAVGLSAVYGQVYRDAYDGERDLAFAPSVRYQFVRGWSAGLSLLLPKERDWYNTAHVVYTTGMELSVRRDWKLLPGLRVSLTALGLLGLTGPYRVVDYYMDGAAPDDIEYESYRWQVGLRPSVSYQFARHWSVELGYGFLGYRSNEDLQKTYKHRSEGNKLAGAWGFNGEMGWGNALRVGINCSF